MSKYRTDSGHTPSSGYCCYGNCTSGSKTIKKI